MGNESIIKYKQFQQKFGDISCIISPVIDMNEMDAAITKSCYLKVNELMMNNDNDNDDDDNKEEQEQECKTEKCKFSDRYRGQFGLLSLNDDKSVLSKPYQQSQQYSFIALDVNPLKNGVHCFKIKVVGQNSFAYFGIHDDVRKASDDYNDKESCGANIFSWHKSDTKDKVTYDDTFESAKKKRSITWHMMVTLSDDGENSLKFTIANGRKKEMTVPILTPNGNWTPYFIFFAGGVHSSKYKDTKVQVFKIDHKLFGQKEMKQ